MQIGWLDVETGANRIHSGIARRAEHFVDDFRLRDFPCEGVFAAARSDNKNFHARSYWTGLDEGSSPQLKAAPKTSW